MAGVNKAIIVGRLGNDPEVKTITNGQTVAHFNVATSENWTDQQGQKQERTQWHRIVVWARLAEVCGQHLSKGRQVYIEGRLSTRSWEDQQGQKRYTTEIIANTVQFLGAPSDRDNSTSMNPAADKDFGAEPSFDTSDEIPF